MLSIALQTWPSIVKHSHWWSLAELVGSHEGFEKTTFLCKRQASQCWVTSSADLSTAKITPGPLECELWTLLKFYSFFTFIEPKTLLSWETAAICFCEHSHAHYTVHTIWDAQHVVNQVECWDLTVRHGGVVAVCLLGKPPKVGVSLLLSRYFLVFLSALLHSPV